MDTNVIEAIRSRSRESGMYITRKAWQYPYSAPAYEGAAIKIMPTNSPDCCLICGVNENKPRRRWQPTAEDLIAEDWITAL